MNAGDEMGVVQATILAGVETRSMEQEKKRR